jgi:hypothetical protein
MDHPLVAGFDNNQRPIRKFGIQNFHLRRLFAASLLKN